jgi:hypothetical protein
MSFGHRTISFLFLTVLFFPQISGQENLSQSSNGSSDPDIAIDSKRRAVVVWTEADWPIPNIGEVFFTIHRNGLWSPGKETFSQLYDAGSPALGLDANDGFHLVYADGKNISSRDIFHRRLMVDDGFWSNIERVILHVKDSSHPRIQVSADGKIFAIWEQVIGQDSQVKIVINSKDEGQPWGEGWENVSQNIGSKTAFPSFEESSGILYACWMDDRNGTWDIFYNERISGIWGSPIGMNGQTENYYPSLCLDKGNCTHIIYATGNGNIFSVSRFNQAWSTPQLISSTAVPGCPTDLALFPHNTLYAVWPEKTVSGASVFFSRSEAGGTWQQPQMIVQGTEADSPRITSDPDGQAHVVWTDRGVSGKRDVYYTQIIPSGVIPNARMIHSESEGILPFTVVFDASSSSTSDGQIISCWWDFGDGSPAEQGIQVSHTYNKEGTFLARLYVTNSQLNVSAVSSEVKILAGPFPPVGVTVQKAKNKALFYREEINSISWEENPKNGVFLTVDGYVIHRKLKGQAVELYSKIGQVDAETHVYADRQFLSPDELEIYDYAVSAVDTQGREGPKAEALPVSAKSQETRFRKKKDGRE